MKKLVIGIFSIISIALVTPMNAQDNDKTNYSKDELKKDQDNTKTNFSKEELKFAKNDASPMDLALYRNQNKQPVARVIYSRPQKRDREIFGKLVPYGEVWRTGANEATELTLYKNMQVGDEVIEAGSYTIYSIPNEKEWTIILNKKINTWGAYEYSEEQDLVRINVPVRKSPNTIESLSMAFQEDTNGANLLIGWDDRYVKVPFDNVK